jgi:hypothetical protein
MVDERSWSISMVTDASSRLIDQSHPTCAGRKDAPHKERVSQAAQSGLNEIRVFERWGGIPSAVPGVARSC